MISGLLSFILKGLYSELRIRFYLIEVSWNNWSMQNVSLRDHPARGESGTWWITNLKLRLEEAARYRGAAIGKPGKTGCRDVQVNLCHKLLFLYQLTHNMTTDFPLNYQFSTWNYKLRTCCVHKLFFVLTFRTIYMYTQHVLSL